MYTLNFINPFYLSTSLILDRQKPIHIHIYFSNDLTLQNHPNN